MKLTMEVPSGAHLVRGYGAGEVRVGESRMTSACIVSPQRLITDWRPQNPAALEFDDLAPVFELAPELALLGWAGGQPYLPARQRAWFLERRIAIEPMELGAACRTYHGLVQDGRSVAALLCPAVD